MSRPPAAHEDELPASDFVPRKRMKKPLSCEPCRRRKLKCDRGYPCGACRDRDEEDNCTWVDGAVPQSTGRDTKSIAEVMQRLSRLEALVERVAAAVDTRAAEPPAPPAANPTPTSTPTPAAAPAPTPAPGSTLFGLSAEHASDAALRRCVVDTCALLRDHTLVYRLCDLFCSEIDWMNHVLDHETLVAHANTATLHRSAAAGVAAGALGRAQLTRVLLSQALLCAAMSNAIVYAKDGASAPDLPRNVMELHGVCMHAALVCLSYLNVLEHPSLDLLCTLILLNQGFTAVRSPLPMFILQQFAVHTAVMLGLDREPPVHLPAAEQVRRLELYALLCVFDWLFLTNYHRLGPDAESAERLPSLFDMHKRHPGVKSNTMLIFDIARLYRRVCTPPASYESVLDAHSSMLYLRRRVEAQMTHPDYARLSVHIKDLFVTKCYSLLDYIGLRLHLVYYMRGWDERAYRLSRDTCYVSAKNLLNFFRLVFSWHLQGEAGITVETSAHKSTVLCIWSFCHWSIAAALLLMKHISILTERCTADFSPQECHSILQDLCIMSRILCALSPRISVAQEGYVAMQRVAGRAEPTLPPGDASANAVPAWAQQAASKLNELQTAEASSTCLAYPPLNHMPGLSDLFHTSDRDMDTLWSRFALPREQSSSSVPLMPSTPDTPDTAELLNYQLAFLQKEAPAPPLGVPAGTFVPAADDFLRSIETGTVEQPAPLSLLAPTAPWP